MPIAMIKGWSPSIRSSIERDSSLLGLLAKLRYNSHNHHYHPSSSCNEQVEYSFTYEEGKHVHV